MKRLTKIKIRKVRKEDLKPLLLLLSQLSPTHNDTPEGQLSSILKKIISDDNYVLIVAELNGKIVGTALLLVQLNLTHGGRSYGHIENVVTDKSTRGLGVGKKMIEYLKVQAKQRGCYKAILNCQEHNIGFYQKSSLKKTGQVEMRIDF